MLDDEKIKKQLRHRDTSFVHRGVHLLPDVIGQLGHRLGVYIELSTGFRSRFETTSLDKNLVNAKCPLGHFAGHSVADALLHNPSTAERVASNSTGLFMPSRP